MIPVRDQPEGASFAVKVHPRAKQDAISGVFGDALKVDLTAPPVEGKANEALTRFFAELLKVPRSSVTIASGKANRLKMIHVAGLTADDLRQRLATFEVR
jgi:uncharacterized protein (TIGR00251 family)